MPWKSESWVMISFVDPSEFRVNAIGRMPALSVKVQSIVFVEASITWIVFPSIDPATTYLPSGVT